MENFRNTKLIFLIPIICGFTTANMYYIQPLASIISSELMVPYEKASMLYSFSLIGNALSLFFIIPLGDFYSKRNLITLLYFVSTVSLLVIFFTKNYYALSAMAFLVGIGTSAIPLIIAGLSREKDGTKYIGRIMAGVLTGILFSRFLSSMFSELWGWKSIYSIAAILMFLSCILLFISYPIANDRNNEYAKSYGHILYLSINGFREDATVRHYFFNAFVIMFLFSAFWSNISMFLTTTFYFSQSQVGVFSLAGITGASSAFFSSRILKSIKYQNKPLFFLVTISLLVMGFYGDHLIVTAIGALLIDAFIQLIHVNNQRGLLLSSKGNEARAMSCYMTSFVTGGACGGFISSYIFSVSGWSVVLISCAIITLIPMLMELRENVNEKH